MYSEILGARAYWRFCENVLMLHAHIYDEKSMLFIIVRIDYGQTASVISRVQAF